MDAFERGLPTWGLVEWTLIPPGLPDSWWLNYQEASYGPLASRMTALAEISPLCSSLGFSPYLKAAYEGRNSLLLGISFIKLEPEQLFPAHGLS